MSSSRSWRLLGCLLLLSTPIRAAAQARIFPDVQSFELPEASPRVHGLVGRIFSARRGDSDFGPEPEAEVAAAWLTYGRGPVRITGNLSYVLIDELGLKRPGAALAADYEGRPFGHFFGGPVRPVGGIFFQGEAATDWRISTSAKLGIAVSRPGGRREIGLALIAHDGLSTQRQFFRHESRYIGGELRFDL